MAGKQDDTQKGGSGNFTNDPQRAKDSDRKMEKQSHQGSSGTPAGGQQGGSKSPGDKDRDAGHKGGKEKS